MKVEEILLSKIIEQERRRQDYGDLKALAAGMKKVGLIEPIVVDRMDNGFFRLVAGGRRLRAARTLKWPRISAVLRDALSDAEMREIELEENDNRKQLVAAERRKTYAATKREQVKAEERILSTVDKKRGRKKKGRVSQEERAEALGVSQATISYADQHIELADQYPWLQSDAWRQADVLRLRQHLGRIPEQEQPELCEFIVRGLAPFPPRPDQVMETAEVMSLKTPAARAEIYRLSKSTDQRERDLAATRSLHRPPMPDHRLAHIREALVWLNKGLKEPLDAEPEAQELKRIILDLYTLRDVIKARFEQLKQQEDCYVEEDNLRRETALTA
jgi:ParB family chromosome partitioning protein